MSELKTIYDRKLKLELPPGQSAFLWGVRQSGKSTYLKTHFPDSYYINLLKTDLFVLYSKSPNLFREHIQALSTELKSRPIIIDEIQKVPLLLDEVHYLIESESLSFILCGSSARKLKRSGVNLLGGRAWKFEFYPLTFAEIPDFDLAKALSHGLLPPHYDNTHFKRAIRAYISEYIKEEIQAASLVRNLPAFSRFLDAVGFNQGGIVTYANIASDVGVDAKTVKEYFQILVDTLLGIEIPPYQKKIRREILSKSPKFYLCDVGVANALANQTLHLSHNETLQGEAAGHAFEHFILMELVAYRGLHEKDFPITYWRTKAGLEVDFILGRGEVAIEVKLSMEVRARDLNGLFAFVEEHQPRRALVISQDLLPRILTGPEGQEILIIPWRDFLTRLWDPEQCLALIGDLN